MISEGFIESDHMLARRLLSENAKQRKHLDIMYEELKRIHKVMSPEAGHIDVIIEGNKVKMTNPVLLEMENMHLKKEVADLRSDNRNLAALLDLEKKIGAKESALKGGRSRFMLFAGECYYPKGGIDDLVSSFNTLEEACDAVKENNGHVEWAHIYDRETREVVKIYEYKEWFDSRDDVWGQSIFQYKR